jgi:hypothetical protein
MSNLQDWNQLLRITAITATVAAMGVQANIAISASDSELDDPVTYSGHVARCE